jgi:hypothetical protein
LAFNKIKHDSCQKSAMKSLIIYIFISCSFLSFA